MAEEDEIAWRIWGLIDDPGPNDPKDFSECTRLFMGIWDSILTHSFVTPRFLSTRFPLPEPEPEEHTFEFFMPGTTIFAPGVSVVSSIPTYRVEWSLVGEDYETRRKFRNPMQSLVAFAHIVASMETDEFMDVPLAQLAGLRSSLFMSLFEFSLEDFTIKCDCRCGKILYAFGPPAVRDNFDIAKRFLFELDDSNIAKRFLFEFAESNLFLVIDRKTPRFPLSVNFRFLYKDPSCFERYFLQEPAIKIRRGRRILEGSASSSPAMDDLQEIESVKELVDALSPELKTKIEKKQLDLLHEHFKQGKTDDRHLNLVKNKNLLFSLVRENCSLDNLTIFKEPIHETKLSDGRKKAFYSKNLFVKLDYFERGIPWSNSNRIYDSREKALLGCLYDILAFCNTMERKKEEFALFEKATKAHIADHIEESRKSPLLKTSFLFLSFATTDRLFGLLFYDPFYENVVREGYEDSQKHTYSFDYIGINHGELVRQYPANSFPASSLLDYLSGNLPDLLLSISPKRKSAKVVTSKKQ